MNIKRKLIYFLKEVARQGKISNIISGIQRALENYKRANSALWVTSLCFYTLLSLVPIFAILFSLGSWLGVAESIIIHLSKYSPLNEEMITFLVQFSENLLENARSGVLAGIGFLSLGWTLITMFSIVEKSFNDIWQVEKSRMILRKITDYIAFFLLFPLLILTINGGMVIIGKKLEGIYDISPYTLQIIPSFSIFLFFTALYMLIPNTKVKLIPAFFSAIFTSVLFSGLQYFFIHLQVMIITYNKIYGSFSVIFIFFFWLKIMWFFIILGAHLSYFLQNKDLKSHSNNVNGISFKSKEYTGMIIIRELIRRYLNNLSPVTVKELAERSNISYDVILHILNIFEENGLVAKVINVKNDNEEGFTILQNIDQINFKKIFNILENSGEDIKLQVNDYNRAFYRIIKNKDFDFLIKDLLENNK
ncbi:YhjD/YihY/BrkB family envelope integrity protein [Fusobacterium varium]|uniref:YhjD/YihY/BrkB family envelope integrity protein n=1 Tax=Fusobacterium varium TaxID=856 RepID=UPI000E4155CE|nr:YhjD/YihY/BrkB family envelope integrity protein [Fusobacterium varium]RGJ30681.1 YihY family inner membrane protein [Fusobacterium varium]